MNQNINLKKNINPEPQYTRIQIFKMKCTNGHSSERCISADMIDNLYTVIH